MATITLNSVTRLDDSVVIFDFDIITTEPVGIVYAIRTVGSPASASGFLETNFTGTHTNFILTLQANNVVSAPREWILSLRDVSGSTLVSSVWVAETSTNDTVAITSVERNNVFIAITGSVQYAITSLTRANETFNVRRKLPDGTERTFFTPTVEITPFTNGFIFSLEHDIRAFSDLDVELEWLINYSFSVLGVSGNISTDYQTEIITSDIDLTPITIIYDETTGMATWDLRDGVTYTLECLEEEGILRRAGKGGSDIITDAFLWRRTNVAGGIWSTAQQDGWRDEFDAYSNQGFSILERTRFLDQDDLWVGTVEFYRSRIKYKGNLVVENIHNFPITPSSGTNSYRVIDTDGAVSPPITGVVPPSFLPDDGDGDGNPIVIRIGDGEAIEGEPVSFQATLNRYSEKVITVDYITLDDTAFAPEDYQETSGTLTFAVGETTKTIIVPTIIDAETETLETFFIVLRNPINVVIRRYRGIGTITDINSIIGCRFRPRLFPYIFIPKAPQTLFELKEN